jgi:hypothetical protein
MGVALDHRLQQHGAGHGPVEIGLGQALGFGGVGRQTVEQGAAAQVRKGRQSAVAQFLGVLAGQTRPRIGRDGAGRVPRLGAGPGTQRVGARHGARLDDLAAHPQRDRLALARQADQSQLAGLDHQIEAGVARQIDHQVEVALVVLNDQRAGRRMLGAPEAQAQVAGHLAREVGDRHVGQGASPLAQPSPVQLVQARRRTTRPWAASF